MHGSPKPYRRTLFASAMVVAAFHLVLPVNGLSGDVFSSTLEQQVATINGDVVSEADLAPFMSAQLQKLREQEYELKNRALEQLIAKRMLESKAAKQGITTDQLIEREVQAKISDPTDGEIEAYYLAQKDQLRRPLAVERSKLRHFLKQARIQQLLEEYVAQLREQAQVVVLLEPPRVQVAADPRRMRGHANAFVTIVEFSDFLCPFCKRVQPTLKEILSKYEGKVRLTFRDLPVEGLHPQARAAAEAANCAQDQGKFWEYHDVLFAQAPKASADDLKSYAIRVGMDGETFSKCIFQRKYNDAVQRDMDEAGKLGLTSTPVFFINGRPISGAQPLEKFVDIIDEELARQPTKVSAANP